MLPSSFFRYQKEILSHGDVQQTRRAALHKTAEGLYGLVEIAILLEVAPANNRLPKAQSVNRSGSRRSSCS